MARGFITGERGPGSKSPRREILPVVLVSRQPAIETDLEILAAEYDLAVFDYRASKGLWLNFTEQVRLARWLTGLLSGGFSRIVIWFGDYHAFLPVLVGRIFNMATFLIVGGYDVACEPGARYGVFYRNGLRRKLVAWSLRHATLCLPVSDYLKTRIWRYVPRARCVTLHTGVDASAFLPGEAIRKPIVFTTANVQDRQRAFIKGVDLYLRTAALLPEIEFRLGGIHPTFIRELPELPPNLVLLDRCPAGELADRYREASVFCQCSRIEGFPTAVAEAMLCGCVPVVMNAGGMPEMVGDCGVVVSDFNPAAIAGAISRALKMPASHRDTCRNRIIDLMPVSRRAEGLLSLLQSWGGQ